MLQKKASAIRRILCLLVLLAVLSACGSASQTVSVGEPSAETDVQEISSQGAVSEQESAALSDAGSAESVNVPGETAPGSTLPPAEGQEDPSASPHSTSSSPEESAVTASDGSSASENMVVTFAVYGPDKSVLLESRTITSLSGASVFTITKEVSEQAGITFKYTGYGSTAYVSQIGDYACSGMSGWVYCINNDFSLGNRSCGAYYPKNGDSVVWYFTKDGGKDIGANF